MLVEGGATNLNLIKYQRTGVITGPSVLVQGIIGSDTHVIDTPTIPICLKTACAVHSVPGETAFHIDGCQACALTVGNIKSHSS